MRAPLTSHPRFKRQPIFGQICANGPHTNANRTFSCRISLGRLDKQRPLIGVSLRRELSTGIAPVMGDRVELQQVIINLAMNGMQAMAAVAERPRDLLIRSQQDGKHVVVAISDSGTGIAPERAERLFASFFTTKPDGMGMGLSICRSIIEAHGGQLWASQNAGPGATFQFTLPCVERRE